MMKQLICLAAAVAISGCGTMSETGGDRPDIGKLHWADGGGAYGKTEPLEAKKDVGYAVNEVPPSVAWNWRKNFEWLVAEWLDAIAIREFSGLNEAIAATTTPQLFRIGQPASGNYLPKVDVFTPLTPPEAGGTIFDVKTDGLRIYVLGALSRIVAVDPETGLTLWSGAPGNPGLEIAATGAALYAAGTGSVGIDEIDPSDGSIIQSAGTVAGLSAIVANGAYAVVINATRAAIYFFSGLGGTLVEDGNVVLGGNYVADDLAIDRNRVYVVARDTVANTTQIRCYDLATRGLLWSYNNPTVPAAKNINSIATDGEFVYLACDSSTLSAPAWAVGEAYNAIALDRHGFFASYADVGTFGDLSNVETDGRLCYFDDGTVSKVTVAGANFGYLWGQGDVIVTDVDGVSSCGYNTSNQVVRRRSADQPVTFQRVDGDDPNRRPFHKLAIPLP